MTLLMQVATVLSGLHFVLTVIGASVGFLGIITLIIKKKPGDAIFSTFIFAICAALAFNWWQLKDMSFGTVVPNGLPNYLIIPHAFIAASLVLGAVMEIFFSNHPTTRIQQMFKMAGNSRPNQPDYLSYFIGGWSALCLGCFILIVIFRGPAG